MNGTQIEKRLKNLETAVTAKTPDGDPPFIKIPEEELKRIIFEEYSDDMIELPENKLVKEYLTRPEIAKEYAAYRRNKNTLKKKQEELKHVSK